MGRHEAFEVFSDLLLPTVSCLEAIANSSVREWNRDSRADAQSLLLAISLFSFTVALRATSSVLSFTRALSVKLQGQYVDRAYAYREMMNVQDVPRGCRSNVDLFHDQIYPKALAIAEMIACTGIQSSSSQSAATSVKCSCPELLRVYRRNVAVPLLDHLTAELESRID